MRKKRNECNELVDYNKLLPTEEEKESAKMKLFSRVSSIADDEYGGVELEDSQKTFFRTFENPTVKSLDNRYGLIGDIPTLQNIRMTYSDAINHYRDLQDNKNIGNIPRVIYNNRLASVRYSVGNASRNEIGAELQSLFFQAKMKAVYSINSCVTAILLDKNIIEKHMFGNNDLAGTMLNNFYDMLTNYINRCVESVTSSEVINPGEFVTTSMMLHNYDNQGKNLIRLFERNRFGVKDINNYQQLNQICSYIKNILIEPTKITQLLYYDIQNILTAVSCGDSELMLEMMATIDKSGVFYMYHDDLVSIADYGIEVIRNLDIADLDSVEMQPYSDYDDDEDYY